MSEPYSRLAERLGAWTAEGRCRRLRGHVARKAQRPVSQVGLWDRLTPPAEIPETDEHRPRRAHP